MEASTSIRDYKKIYDQCERKAEEKFPLFSPTNVYRYLKQDQNKYERKKVQQAVFIGAGFGAMKGVRSGAGLPGMLVGGVVEGVFAGVVTYMGCDLYIETSYDPYKKWKLEKKKELTEQEFNKLMEHIYTEKLVLCDFFSDTAFSDVISGNPMQDPVILKTECRVYDRSTIVEHFNSKKIQREKDAIHRPDIINSSEYGGLDCEGKCPGIICSGNKFDIHTDLEPCYQTKFIIHQFIKMFIKTELQVLSSYPESAAKKQCIKFYENKLKNVNKICKEAHKNALKEINLLFRNGEIDGVEQGNLLNYFWNSCGMDPNEDLFDNASPEERLEILDYANNFPRPNPKASRYIPHGAR